VRKGEAQKKKPVQCPRTQREITILLGRIADAPKCCLKRLLKEIKKRSEWGLFITRERGASMGKVGR